MRSAILIATALLLTPLTASAGAITVTTRIVQRSSSSSSASRDDAAGRAMLKNVASAQSDINRVLNELRRDHEQSAELREARSALRTAQMNYQDACNVALEPVRSSAQYKQARENILTLERKLTWGRYDNHMSDEQIATTASALLKARLVVTTMESQALTADPNLPTVRYAMMDANGRLVGLQRSFNQSIVSDSQYLQARARLDDARSQISGSR
ncbi:MAG: hypothetical protein H7Z14_03755 [Anaerolineae bacterium]|nr:hypothetical protein [Phycisphaerae bacterium]